jgi:CBS domain-containing protein
VESGALCCSSFSSPFGCPCFSDLAISKNTVLHLADLFLIEYGPLTDRETPFVFRPLVGILTQRGTPIIESDNHHVLLTGSQGGPVKIITDLDVAQADAHASAETLLNTPVTINDDQTVADVVQLMKQTTHSTIPVLKDGRLIGIVTGSGVKRKLLEDVKITP